MCPISRKVSFEWTKWPWEFRVWYVVYVNYCPFLLNINIYIYIFILQWLSCQPLCVLTLVIVVLHLPYFSKRIFQMNKMATGISYVIGWTHGGHHCAYYIFICTSMQWDGGTGRYFCNATNYFQNIILITGTPWLAHRGDMINCGDVCGVMLYRTAL